MFEISDETLKEMQQIKDTCEFLECYNCNYYDESEDYFNGHPCKLNKPFHWNLESEVGDNEN